MLRRGLLLETKSVRLLSVAGKIIEKLLNNRPVDHLEKCGLLSDFQYSFKSSCLTVDLWIVVSNGIASRYSNFCT